MSYPKPGLITEPAARYLDNLDDHLPRSDMRRLARDLFGPGARADDVDAIGTGRYFQNVLEANLEEAEAVKPDQNIFEFFTVNDTLGQGADTYSQKLKEKVGKARIANDDGSPAPRADVVRRKVARDIVNLEIAYDWSAFDVMKARFGSMDLETDKGAAAREGMDELHNDLGWWGSDADAVWGLLNHPGIPRFIFSNPIDRTTDGNTIAAEIIDWFGTVEDITNTAASADTLILPPTEHRHIAHRELSAGSGAKIIDWIRGNDENDITTIDKAWELAPEHNGGTPLAVAILNDAAPQYVAPLPWQQMPAQRDGLQFEVFAIGQSGGFYTPYPKHICIAELTRS